MEFVKTYTRETKDKKSMIFNLSLTKFASKVKGIFFKRKTSVLTKLNLMCFVKSLIFVKVFLNFC